MVGLRMRYNAIALFVGKDEQREKQTTFLSATCGRTVRAWHLFYESIWPNSLEISFLRNRTAVASRSRLVHLQINVNPPIRIVPCTSMHRLGSLSHARFVSFRFVSILLLYEYIHYSLFTVFGFGIQYSQYCSRMSNVEWSNSNSNWSIRHS